MHPTPAAAAAEQLPVYDISCAGFAAHLEAFARERHAEDGGLRLWLVSLVGGVTAVRAIWANLLQGELATIRRADEPLGWNHALVREGVRWHAYQSPLPSEGALHLLLLPDRSAYAAELADFVLVPRAHDDPALLHYRFLQRRVRLPLHQSWSRWLWQRAVGGAEAVPLEGFSCRVYRCQPNAERLSEDLSTAIAAGELGVDREGDLACAA